MMRNFLPVLLLAALSACSPAKLEFNGTDISGADFAQSFHLSDHTGKVRELKDFKGKVVVLFFGYTHCPDVCPTTMMDMANAMKLMDAEALASGKSEKPGDEKPSDEVQVLFMTVDPERDTQQVLAQYVPSFDRRFLGLYGTAAQTDEAAKNFKIFYAKQAEAGKSGYTIDHSAGSYVFDKNGNVRVYLKYGQKPQEIAHDLMQLL